MNFIIFKYIYLYEKKLGYILFSIVFLINFSFILSSIYGNTLFVALAQFEPISTIEKVSDKGYYLVQFKIGSGTIAPEIPVDIVFSECYFSYRICGE